MRHGAGERHRLDLGHDRRAQPRAGPRDGVRAGRGRDARHATRSMVEIVHGDTSKIPFGMGTYGSRSLAVGGSAMVRATDKIIDKAKKIAAHLLEASEAISTFEGRRSSPWRAPTSRWPSAMSRWRPTCRTTTRSRRSSRGWRRRRSTTRQLHLPGRRLCLRGRGRPRDRQGRGSASHAADDFGNVINPMIVEGQVHGGVAQGIGQALLEHCVSMTRTASCSALLHGLRHAAGRRRADVTVDHSCQTPCTHNPLGVKGCGEAGAIGSPPAVINWAGRCFSKARRASARPRSPRRSPRRSGGG
jgi:carbon-monoxide dehydrogenase large subunit